MTQSQLLNLKTALAAFSQETEKASQGMAASARSLDSSAQRVLSLIGGSATGKDREVASAVQQAQRAIKEAGNALAQASRTASQYGASI
jgi:hypothetical protein